MKRGRVCVLAAMLFMCSAVAMAAVTGRVTDTSGEPVNGALVTFIEDSDAGYFLYRDTTDAQGYYEIDLTNPTGNEEQTPTAFLLDQNYPNPFNPTTTIPFTLDTPTHATLTIYNIMGQRISTLIDEYLGAGSHAIVWNGSDDSGNHMSSGVYFYRLRAGGHTATKKMLLLDGGRGFSGGAPVVSSKPAQVYRTAQDIEGIEYAVTITHDDVVDYQETGIRTKAGKAVNFVVSPIGEAKVLDGLTMIPIAGGSFRTGVYLSEVYNPDTLVTVSSFEISEYEITQELFERFMGTNPSTVQSGPDYPVECVSKRDAQLFCNALSTYFGLMPCYSDDWGGMNCNYAANGFRLPTRSEWTYACFGGTTTDFYTGDTEEDLADAAWYTGNSGNVTHPVGQKKPNQYGLYDMHGNVWEWVMDTIKPPAWKTSSIINYTGYQYSGPDIIVGGSYRMSPSSCRSGYWEINLGDNLTDIGFRVVRRPNGYGLVQPVEDPVLQSFELVPENPTLSANELFSARYQVRNPNRVAMDVQLLLRYKSDSGSTGEFTILDQPVSINPGTGWYVRSFAIPYDMPEGKYSVSWIITDMQDTELDASTYQESQLTVSYAGMNILDELALVEIPGGTFIMGEETSPERYPDNPAHEVQVSSFLMGAYEITQSQYQAVMNSNPSEFALGGEYPVERVQWTDAARFCNRLSTLAGLEKCYNELTWACDISKNGFRLPTEAEWEYACRAGTDTEYSSGDTEYILSFVSWIDSNSNGQTHPVRQKIPNHFGLYDMHGNVWEWCNDEYVGYYYTDSLIIDPARQTSIIDGVLRGGNYEFAAEYCRSAYRHSRYKTSHHPTRYDGIGFRVVRRPEYYIPGQSIKTITLVDIPGGVFEMGEDSAAHEVMISDFMMGKYEVTQFQYEVIMGENPSVFAEGEDYPVENVSWYDAVRFCNRLSDFYTFERCYDEETWECDFTKNGFRLPTEAEWEYTCRAGTTTDYFIGNEDDSIIYEGLPEICWFAENSNDMTHPVGSKLQNPFNLYNMYGNVAEWCNDWYDYKYYSVSPGENPTGPDEGIYRVIRGGSWNHDATQCESARRGWAEWRGGANTIGMRVVRRP